MYVLAVQLVWWFAANNSLAVVVVGKLKPWWPFTILDPDDKAGLQAFVKANPAGLVVWDCYGIYQPDDWQDLHHRITQLVLCSHPRGAVQLVRTADTVVTFAWPSAVHHFYDAREILYQYAFRAGMGSSSPSSQQEFNAMLDKLSSHAYLVAKTAKQSDGSDGSGGNQSAQTVGVDSVDNNVDSLFASCQADSASAVQTAKL